MVPEQESKTVPPPSSRAQLGQPTGRRGRSGRRHRSRRGRSQPQAEPAAEGMREGLSSETSTLPSAAAAGFAESGPASRHETTARRSDEPSRAPRSAIQKAIDEVNQIVVALRGALDDMEEVFETMEVAERQKKGDEEEIETLRRALRGLRRPREEAHEGR